MEAWATWSGVDSMNEGVGGPGSPRSGLRIQVLLHLRNRLVLRSCSP